MAVPPNNELLASIHRPIRYKKGCVALDYGIFYTFIILSCILVSLLALNGCDSKPPVLMKAVKQFESKQERERHIIYMRKNHMAALKHKSNETIYKGIRSEKHSINACINCHVPESYNGKVLRHSNQAHFCTTCHTYVGTTVDCFECHVDHPIKDQVAENTSAITGKTKKTKILDKDELLSLAFKYVEYKYIDNSNNNFNSINKNKRLSQKTPKDGGVSFIRTQHASPSHTNQYNKTTNE